MNDNSVFSNSPNIYGPITPSRMFERTFALLRENPKLFFGIAAILIGVEIVIGGVLGGSGIWMAHSSVGTVPITRVLVTIPLALLGALMIYVFTQIIQGAIFLATQSRLANVSMSVGEACRLAADNVGRLVGISLLVALRILGYMLLFYFALAILIGAVILLLGGLGHLTNNLRFHPGTVHAPALLFGTGALVILFMLAFLVLDLLAMLWLAARYAVSIPAALAENISVTEAIRRSIHLTRGSKGRLYALFMGICAFYVVIAACLFPLQLMIAHSSILSLGTAPAKIGGITTLLGVFEYIVGAIVLVFMGVGTALCYYDLRVRKESLGGTIASSTLGSQSTSPPATDWPIEDLPVS